jgi:formylglycine-generating enzyme required for sulfatase activity
MPPPDCPSIDVLNRYAAGDLDDDSAAALNAHLATCETCLTVLDSGTPPDSAFAGLRGLAAGPSSAYGRLADTLTNRDRPVPSIPGYQILGPLGQGGMGTVYKAVHAKLGKTVAIKVLRGGRDRGAVARFEREMKAVGRLDHPHVVRATDAGEAGGEPYLVMEYVPGTDFAKLVKANGPLRPETAKRYVAELAAGLAAAHAAGMVHRDVKPSNAILTETGTVKLLDLGLALLPPAAPADDTTPDRTVGTGLTLAGKAMGTKDYMAPEQQTNPRAADARADVYGLGATLWFLLTGSPPEPARFHETLTFPGSLTKAEWLRFLASDPAERFGTAAEAAEFLFPRATLPSPRVVRPGARASLVAAVTIACVSIPGWFILRPHPPVTEGGDRTVGSDAVVADPNRTTKMKPDGGVLPMSADEAEALQRRWADYLDVTTFATDGGPLTDRTKPLPFHLALIPPGGPFPIRGGETASVAKPFYLAPTEVTVEQFSRFVATRTPPFKTTVEITGKGQLFFGEPHKLNRQRLGPDLNWKNPGFDVSADMPVTYVSYEDATAYCEWLSATTKHRYRLPTVVEWKWACRAGTETKYYTGESIASTEPYEWLRSTAKMTPQRTGVKKANPWGLRDMVGNVMEMTGDRTNQPSRIDSQYEYANGLGAGNYHYVCGGSYVSLDDSRDPPIGSDALYTLGVRVGTSRVGFRVLREIP